MKQFHIIYVDGYTDSDPATTMWLGVEFFTDSNGFEPDETHKITEVMGVLDTLSLWDLGVKCGVVVRVK